MRANTDRSLALSFDAVAQLYDDVRPRFRAELVAAVLRRAGINPRDADVLEIGAGTGQLTDALLQLGSVVTAIEPGQAMSNLLDDRVTVVTSTFEDARFAGQTFDAVVSANAFHWVDPAVGHRKAAQILKPDGALVLLWNFPMPMDEEAQGIFNDVVKRSMPDAVVVRDEFVAQIERASAEGRAELSASKVLSVEDWGWEIESIPMTPRDRLRLSASYASTIGVTDGEIDRLAAEVEQRGITSCDMEHRVYWLVARPDGDVVPDPTA